jgi:hypothetical protein
MDMILMTLLLLSLLLLLLLLSLLMYLTYAPLHRSHPVHAVRGKNKNKQDMSNSKENSLNMSEFKKNLLFPRITELCLRS